MKMRLIVNVDGYIDVELPLSAREYSFGDLLRRLREKSGIGASALQKSAGIDHPIWFAAEKRENTKNLTSRIIQGLDALGYEVVIRRKKI